MCAIGRQETTRPSSGNAITSSKPRTADSRFPCVSCTPLGGPGGARRVDQREDVVGLDGPPGGLEVEVRGRPPASTSAIDERALGAVRRRRPRGARRPSTARPRWSRKACSVTTMRASASLTRYWICSRRVGVVDRERRGAEVQRGGVEPVELGPVGEHDRRACRRGSRPSAGQARGERSRPCRRTRPRSSSNSSSFSAQRHAVGVRRGGELEGLGQRRGVEARRAARCGVPRWRSMLSSLRGTSARGSLPHSGSPRRRGGRCRSRARPGTAGSPA